MAAEHDTDLELALKLEEEWKKEETTNEKSEMSDAEYALLLSEQLNQAPAPPELDMDGMLALQLQKEEEERQAKEQAEQQKLLAQQQQHPKPPPPSQHKDPYIDNFYAPSTTPLTKQARKRIFQDLKAIIINADPTLHVYFGDDVTTVEALVLGPSDTPYEGGMFHFTMRFPHNYPWASPKVILRTTDNGCVRFNPNLYANGKVCLSILGTWSGPAWSPIQTVSSVLLSIQSLMNKYPYYNEPGYEKSNNTKDRDAYNQFIQHETIRVAVLGMMEDPTWGENGTLNEIRDKIFVNMISVYEGIIQKNMHLDGTHMRDMFGRRDGGVFKYQQLWDHLQRIKTKLIPTE